MAEHVLVESFRKGVRRSRDHSTSSATPALKPSVGSRHRAQSPARAIFCIGPQARPVCAPGSNLDSPHAIAMSSSAGNSGVSAVRAAATDGVISSGLTSGSSLARYQSLRALSSDSPSVKTRPNSNRAVWITQPFNTILLRLVPMNHDRDLTAQAHAHRSFELAPVAASADFDLAFARDELVATCWARDRFGSELHTFRVAIADRLAPPSIVISIRINFTLPLSRLASGVLPARSQADPIAPRSTASKTSSVVDGSCSRSTENVTSVISAPYL